MNLGLRNVRDQGAIARMKLSVEWSEKTLLHQSKLFPYTTIFCASYFYICDRDFIYPLFIHEADYKEEISSMPDCFRHSLKTMIDEVAEAVE